SIGRAAADWGRGGQIGIAGARRRERIDVGRLAPRDLAKGMAVELAEPEIEVEGIPEGRRDRATEVPDPRSGERTRRGARARGLADGGRGAERRLAAVH